MNNESQKCFHLHHYVRNHFYLFFNIYSFLYIYTCILYLALELLHFILLQSLSEKNITYSKKKTKQAFKLRHFRSSRRVLNCQLTQEQQKQTQHQRGSGNGECNCFKIYIISHKKTPVIDGCGGNWRARRWLDLSSHPLLLPLPLCEGKVSDSAAQTWLFLHVAHVEADGTVVCLRACDVNKYTSSAADTLSTGSLLFFYTGSRTGDVTEPGLGL